MSTPLYIAGAFSHKQEKQPMKLRIWITIMEIYLVNYSRLKKCAQKSKILLLDEYTNYMMQLLKTQGNFEKIWDNSVIKIEDQITHTVFSRLGFPKTVLVLYNRFLS